MKPEELRVGNLIDAYHGHVTVTGIGEDGIIYHTPNLIGATFGGILSGIPVTEEWMEKLGMRRFYYDNWFTHDSASYEGEDHPLHIRYGDELWIGNKKLLKIAYVHELQNAWRILTRYELEIK